MQSAFVGVRWLRFLVMMSPALENSFSLATNVARIASRRQVTLATSGYDVSHVTVAAYQQSGHWSRAVAGAATYRSNSCWADACEWQYCGQAWTRLTQWKSRMKMWLAAATANWALQSRRSPWPPSCTSKYAGGIPRHQMVRFSTADRRSYHA